MVLALHTPLISDKEKFDEKFGEDKEHLNSISRDLIEGAKFLHSRGIAHLDIKPDNIFLSRVPVSDDELAALLEHEPPEYWPTRDVLGRIVRPPRSQPLPLPALPQSDFADKDVDWDQEVARMDMMFVLGDFGHGMSPPHLYHLSTLIAARFGGRV